MNDDNMQEHEPGNDLDVLAGDMFREAIEAHLDEEDNLTLVHDAFNTLVDSAVGAGGIVVTGRQVKRLLRDHLWARMNNRAGRATYTCLKELTSGQLAAFTVPELLDTPVTVGQKRRTLIRHLNPQDIQRMLAEREANLAKQEAATADFRQIAVTLLGWMATYETIPRAIAEGGVDLAEGEASA